jgi:hypothetical protein
VLRRLFISLLILSALTSKGAVNSIFNTFEMLTPGSLFNLSGDLNLPGNKLCSNEGREVLNTRSYSIKNTVATLEEILKKSNLKNYVFSDFSIISYDISYGVGIPCAEKVYRQGDAIVISYGSDASPPKI